MCVMSWIKKKETQEREPSSTRSCSTKDKQASKESEKHKEKAAVS